MATAEMAIRAKAPLVSAASADAARPRLDSTPQIPATRPRGFRRPHDQRDDEVQQAEQPPPTRAHGPAGTGIQAGDGSGTVPVAMAVGTCAAPGISAAAAAMAPIVRAVLLRRNRPLRHPSPEHRLERRVGELSSRSSVIGGMPAVIVGGGLFTTPTEAYGRSPFPLQSLGPGPIGGGQQGVRRALPGRRDAPSSRRRPRACRGPCASRRTTAVFRQLMTIAAALLGPQLGHGRLQRVAKLALLRSDPVPAPSQLPGSSPSRKTPRRWLARGLRWLIAAHGVDGGVVSDLEQRQAREAGRVASKAVRPAEGFETKVSWAVSSATFCRHPVDEGDDRALDTGARIRSKADWEAGQGLGERSGLADRFLIDRHGVSSQSK